MWSADGEESLESFLEQLDRIGDFYLRYVAQSPCGQCEHWGFREDYELMQRAERGELVNEYKEEYLGHVCLWRANFTRALQMGLGLVDAGESVSSGQ